MRFVTLIAFLALFSACGKAPIVDPAIQPYVDRFTNEAKNQGKMVSTDGLILEFQDLHGIEGTCQTDLSGIHVRIDSESWNAASADSNHEMIVFHELGHCLLHRQHRNDTYPNGTAVSIMNASGVDSADYTEHHTQLVQELFNN